MERSWVDGPEWDGRRVVGGFAIAAEDVPGPSIGKKKKTWTMRGKK